MWKKLIEVGMHYINNILHWCHRSVKASQTNGKSIFVQTTFPANNKEDIKDSHCWPFVRESTGQNHFANQTTLYEMTDGVLQNNVIYTGPEFMQPFANRCAGTWRCYHQQAHWWLLSLLLSITGFSDFISIAYTCNPKSKPSLNKKKLHFYVCFVNLITQLNNDVWRASRRQKFLATLLVVQRCSSSQRRKNFPNTSNLWWEPPLIWWMTLTKGHWFEKCFHVMASTWLSRNLASLPVY